MTHAELSNWIALYVATFCCCVVALATSVGSIAIEMVREKAWTSVRSPRDAILFIPKTWWRWQQRYLLSTPVTLAIVGWFATTLRW